MSHYTKRSELLAEAARVLAMCGEDDALAGRCVKHGVLSVLSLSKYNFFDLPACYDFALTLVEGKPVFEGDVLWVKPGCNAWIIDGGKIIATGHRLDRGILTTDSVVIQPEHLTWNPPQPTFKRGEPVMGVDECGGEYRLYFAEGKRCFDSGANSWTSEATSEWSDIRKLTPEELAEHDRLVNAWRD